MPRSFTPLFVSCVVLPGCAVPTPLVGQACGATRCGPGEACSAEQQCVTVCVTQLDCGIGEVCAASGFCQEQEGCGNGALEGTEACDDRNLSDGDGCSSDCAVEAGWACSGVPSTCEETAGCGNGVLDPGEACDDNDTDPLDGCSALCQIESNWTCQPGPSGTSQCLRIPAPPDVIGETSAGHFNPGWLWSVPLGTASLRYSFDDIPGVTEVDAGTSGTARLVPDEGPYTIHVAACNAHGGCSAPTSFTTVVELFGKDYPPAWRGVARALPQTALGNVVGVSCHNCYNGPGDQVYDLDQANAKVDQALANGADLIEIDVGVFDGTLYAYHGVPTDDGAPTLAQMLDNPTLAESDAMLFLEVKESEMPPAAFAARLLDILDARRHYARNGRPVFIRGFSARLPYLLEIKDALGSYPLIRPYVRFSVLYEFFGLDPQLYDAIDNDVVANGFHGVEVEYRTSNLFAPLMYARSLGLMAGVWTIPASFGEVFVAAMRDDVDQMTMEYRVDLGREVIEEVTTAGYFNAATMTAGPLVVRRNLGTYTEKTIPLDTVAGTITPHGTPSLEVLTREDAEDRFGGSMLFDPANSEAVELWDVDADPGEGFLVTAVVNFDDLDLSNNADDTMAILNKSQTGGFALELFYDGTETLLRFGVHVGGAYVYHVTPVAGLPGPSSHWTSPLTGSPSYLLTGAYDGSGGVYLFINNKRATTTQPQVAGTVTSNDVSAFAGADPEAAGASRYYFAGKIQQVSIQRWAAHGAGSN